MSRNFRLRDSDRAANDLKAGRSHAILEVARPSLNDHLAWFQPRPLSLAFKVGAEVWLLSRNRTLFNENYPILFDERSAWAKHAHGAYPLRTNCPETDPVKLWRWYIQLQGSTICAVWSRGARLPS
jgi:hypothetical protein